MLFLLLSLVAATILWPVILSDWRRGLYLMLIYLPFAGVVTMLFIDQALAKISKDLLIALPAYFGFFLAVTTRREGLFVSPLLSYLIFSLAALATFQLFNPGVYNWMSALIGMKVWLFYLPFVFLVAAATSSRLALFSMLRLMVVISIIPCVIGLSEWILSSLFGYQNVMKAIYGDLALVATQRFSEFHLGASFIRIPSTFTFTAQYFGFTFAMLVPAYAVMRCDPSARWRKIATYILTLIITASFLSGARAAFVFVPLLFLITLALEGRSASWKVFALVALGMMAAFTISGVSVLMLYQVIYDLLFHYGRVTLADQLMGAIIERPFGEGVGVNTGAARYAFQGVEQQTFLMAGAESYYAKAVIELGLLGFIIVVAIFATLCLITFQSHRLLKRVNLTPLSAIYFAFFFSMAINSIKGWHIDLDPINVYFWFFAGQAMRFPHLAVEQSPANQPWQARPNNAPNAVFPAPPPSAR